MIKSRAGGHLICLAAALGAGFLFLFSPPPQGKDQDCHLYSPLSARAGMMVNCDAYTYLLSAESPQLLFADNNMRQSRPLYILAGKLAGLTAFYLSGWSSTRPYYMGYYYVGYWGLNFILIYLSMVLFLRLGRSAEVDWALSLAAVPLLACNIITKNFIWTPHSQLFSIFTPLFGAYLSALVLRRHQMLGLLGAAEIGLIVGLLSLAYGNFIVLTPCLIAAAALRYRRQGMLNPRNITPPAIILIVTTALPTLIWIAWVTMKVGRYYNHEMAKYRQLIWVLDELRKGPVSLIEAFAANTWQFIRTFANLDVAVILALTLAAAAILTILSQPQPAQPSPRIELSRDIKWAAGIVFASFFAFFWVLGYYQARLTFTLCPPALLILVIIVDQLASASSRARLIARAGFAVASGVWCCYHIFSYGPFY